MKLNLILNFLCLSFYFSFVVSSFFFSFIFFISIYNFYPFFVSFILCLISLTHFFKLGKLLILLPVFAFRKSISLDVYNTGKFELGESLDKCLFSDSVHRQFGQDRQSLRSKFTKKTKHDIPSNRRRCFLLPPRKHLQRNPCFTNSMSQLNDRNQFRFPRTQFLLLLIKAASLLPTIHIACRHSELLHWHFCSGFELLEFFIL